MRWLRSILLVTALAFVVAGTAQAAPPTTSSAPVITGQLYVGRTLTTSNGLWTNSPTRYTYQWLRCDDRGGNCAEIATETNKTYVLAKADVGKTIVALVTAINGDGSATANSKPTEVVSDALPPKTSTRPTIIGQAAVGEQLVVKLGTYTGGRPASYSFQWQRCEAATTTCANISGATGQTYGVINGDVGRRLRIQVIARNPFGTDTAVSDPTAAVTATPTVVRVTTSLTASESSVTCCAAVRLSGAVSGGAANEPIVILAKEYDAIATAIVATTKTDSSGNWTVSVSPSVQTTYQAKTSTDISPGITIGVRPRVGLGKSRGVFTAKVTARDSFAGKVVFFQRQTVGGGWKTLQAIVLDTTGRARFTVALPKGPSIVRAFLSARQAGAGYLPNASATRAVRR